MWFSDPAALLEDSQRAHAGDLTGKRRGSIGEELHRYGSCLPAGSRRAVCVAPVD